MSGTATRCLELSEAMLLPGGYRTLYRDHPRDDYVGLAVQSVPGARVLGFDFAVEAALSGYAMSVLVGTEIAYGGAQRERRCARDVIIDLPTSAPDVCVTRYQPMGPLRDARGADMAYDVPLAPYAHPTRCPVLTEWMVLPA
eukprot:419294-Rhodomonas_salina.2